MNREHGQKHGHTDADRLSANGDGDTRDDQGQRSPLAGHDRCAGSGGDSAGALQGAFSRVGCPHTATTNFRSLQVRQGIMPVHNPQAIVSPLDTTQASEGGMLITAAQVVRTAADSAPLVTVAEASEESRGTRVPIALVKGEVPYSGNLEASTRRGRRVCDARTLSANGAGSFLERPVRLRRYSGWLSVSSVTGIGGSPLARM